jgi:predicted permease
MPRARDQGVALVRLFLARFFENESAASGDLRMLFASLIAFLAAPGFILPPLVGFGWSYAAPDDPASWGWNLIARRLGPHALRTLSVGDKSLYLGFAGLSAALVAAIVWRRLRPDRRDALVLGTLPVPSRTVVGARMAALATFASGVAIGAHALASITFGLLLAAGNTLAFAGRGIAAHFIASVGATLFVFAMAVALQGIVLVATGPRVFARAAALMQAAWVGATIAGVLALPLLSRAALAALHHDPGAPGWLLMTPPLWFLGLYESLLGTADGTMTALARNAVVATLGATAVAALVYPLAYRRVEAAAIYGGHARRRARHGRRRLLARIAPRRSAIAGLSRFFLMTMARIDRHRLVLATACGLVAAWTIAGWITLQSVWWGLPPLQFFSLPLAAEVFLLVAIRIAAGLPADLGAAWVFDAAPPARHDVRAALERVMGLIGIAPPVIVSTVLVARWWGPYAALLHATFASACGALAAEALLWQAHDVPCTREAAPERAHLRTRWPAYLVAFLLFTGGMAAIEALCITSIIQPDAYPGLTDSMSSFRVIFIGVVAGLAWLVRRASFQADPADDGQDFRVLTSALQDGRADGAPTGPDRSWANATGRPREMLASFSSRGAPDERWFEGFSLHAAELRRDVRIALRRLSHARAFAAFAIVTLAIGIGSTTAVYSLVLSMLSRPMTIHEPQRVVSIGQVRERDVTQPMSWPDLVDLRKAQTTCDAIEAWSETQASLTAGGTALVTAAHLVTGGYFNLLGIAPLLGRTLQPADDEPGAPAVLVLAESAWRARFAADPAIVGRLVRVGGRPYQVVGVIPGSFRGIHVSMIQPTFWAALAHPPLSDPASEAFRDRGRRDRAYLHVMGRMRRAATVTRVAADARRVAIAIDAATPLPADGAGRKRPRGWTASALGDRQIWPKEVTRVGALLIALPLVVLLIACTNLANLVLSRGAPRRQEMRLRRALGASRWSLVRGELVEHGLLAAAGAMGGMALAHVLLTHVVSYVQRALGTMPRTDLDARVDPAALAVASAAAVLAVVVAGFAPALHLSRARAGEALGTSAAAVPRWRGQRYLIALQVAASLTLLLLAAACVRQLATIDALERWPRVAAASIDFALRTHDEDRVHQSAARIVEEAARAPDIQAAAVASALPASAWNPKRGVSVTAASSRIFRVLGIPLARGRTFSPAEEVPGGPPAAVVSESEARALFGTIDAVGRELPRSELEGDTRASLPIIVGIAADIGHDAGTGEGVREVYVPFAARPARDPRLMTPPVLVLARSSGGDAAAAVPSLVTAIRHVDADLPVRFAGTADLLIDGPISLLGVAIRALGALALVALALSMSGLYSVTSHLVASRTREMGIRLALGADARSIIRLVMRDAARPVLQGVVIGFVAAAILRMAIRPIFPSHISALDPLALVLALAPLVLAAAVACYVPARRASRVDPNEAVRQI